MFGNLFGSTTEETVYDPYKHMPGWQEKYYKTMTNRLTGNVNKGRDIRKELMDNPQQWENLSEQERMALEELNQSGAEADQYSDAALGLVGGIPGMSEEMMARLTGESAGMYEGLLGGGYGDMPTTMEEMQQYYDFFENPYEDEVIDATMAEYDRETARGQQALNQRVGSVTGDRGAHMRAALGLEGNAMDRAADRGSLFWKMKDEGWKNARTMGGALAGDLSGRTMDLYGAGRDDLGFRAEQEASNIGRIFESAGELDRLANSKFGRDQSLYSQRAAQGQAQREINDANREAQRTAGKDAVSWYAGLIPNPMGTAPGVTYTQEEKPSTFGKIAGTAANIAGAFLAASDEDVKTDITLDETSALDKLSKLPTYEYRYKEGEGHRTDRTAGMMAQDVENAGIVGGTLDIDGVKHVDAFPVMATIVQAVRELDARTKEAA